MPETWFHLSRDDQGEALEVAASRTGRPAHLLEKDIWALVPDLLREGNPIPLTVSQEKKISSAVRTRLPARRASRIRSNKSVAISQQSLAKSHSLAPHLG